MTVRINEAFKNEIFLITKFSVIKCRTENLHQVENIYIYCNFK